jgi:hypothetical protein
MTSERESRRVAAALDRRFEALVFDWDGTAVPDRASDAKPVRSLIEELCGSGMHVGIVSGTTIVAERPQRVVVAGHGAIADTNGITFQRSGATRQNGTRVDH